MWVHTAQIEGGRSQRFLFLGAFVLDFVFTLHAANTVLYKSGASIPVSALNAGTFVQ